MENKTLISSQSLVHFLTGHGPYPTYLHRMYLRDDYQCKCEDLATPEHKFFDCRLAEEQTLDEQKAFRGATVSEILNNHLLIPALNSLASKVFRIEQEQYRL